MQGLPAAALTISLDPFLGDLADSGAGLITVHSSTLTD